MTLHSKDSATPIHRTWKPLLTSALAIGLLLLTPPTRAQSANSAEPIEPPSVSVGADDSSEEESSSGHCPCCGNGGGRGRGKGVASGTGNGHGGRGRGQGERRASGRPEAEIIHFLIDNHQQLERTVETIPGGVRTRTLSQDPEITQGLRDHVRQMATLIHDGGRIRNWDPLFREIFDHRQAITMEIADIEGGVEVVETSTDPEVAQLIRAHASKVEEFVARGIEAYRQETPLPAGYSDASP